MGEQISHGDADPEPDIYEIVLGRVLTEEEISKGEINFSVECLKTAIEKFRLARPDAPDVTPIPLGLSNEQLAVIIDGKTIFIITEKSDSY